MAKAIRVFSGYDTYGRHVERAQRLDGVWFARYQHETNYGIQYCKWYEDAPEFEEYGENIYTAEKVKHEKPKALWGFNKLDERAGPHRLRLPNIQN